jgi:hypothetical protein
VQVIEDAVAKALRGFAAPTAADRSLEDMQSLQIRMEDSMSKVQVQLTQLVTQLMDGAMVKMQTETDRRADAMLRKLVQMLNIALRKDDGKTMPLSRDSVVPERAAQVSSRQGQQQPVRAAQEVTGIGAQATTGWTTVTNSKKKSKKHPLDQRRVLFARNSQSRACDPRDIMFEVNKALAHARAHVAVDSST